MEIHKDAKRWKFSVAALVAAAVATVLAIEAIPAVGRPIGQDFPLNAPFPPRFFNLLYSLTAVVIYTVIQEHMLLLEHSRGKPLPFLIPVFGLAIYCGLASLIPMAVDVADVRARDLGIEGGIARAVAALAISTPILGGYPAPSVAAAYLLRRRMERGPTAKALRFYLVGLAGLGLLFCAVSILPPIILTGATLIGDPLIHGLGLFAFLIGTIGLFAGGLGQLLTRRDREPATAVKPEACSIRGHS